MEKLNEIQGKSPFRVPENYFAEVNRKIISATSGNESAAKKVSPYRRLKPYLTIAAFVSGFILISYSTLKYFSSKDLGDMIPRITLQEFSDSYLHDIDLRTLEESGAALLLSAEEPDISNSDIIDYLLNENVNINEIYEQF